MNTKILTSIFVVLTCLLLMNIQGGIAEAALRRSALTPYEISYSKGFIDGYWKASQPRLYNLPSFSNCRGNDVRVKYYKNRYDNLLGKARNGFAKNKFKNRKDYCTIKINMRNMVDQPSWKVCLTFVHEYGHLMGLSHSKDPNNIMFERYDSRNDLIAGCKHAHL